MRYFNKTDNFLMERWILCQKGDLTQTRVNIEDGTPEEDLVAWEELNYDHVLCHGIHRKQSRYLQLQKQLMLARLDLIITGDRFIQNKIDDILLEMKIAFPEDTTTVDYSKAFIMISKWMGQLIRSNQVFVKEFFTMIEMYNSEHNIKPD